LLTQHLTAWYTDHRRWLDALYQAWAQDPDHGESNREHLSNIVGSWLPCAAGCTAVIAAQIDKALDTQHATAAHRSETDAVATKFTALGMTLTKGSI
jgi:phenol hydroxylase P1 protein